MQREPGFSESFEAQVQQMSHDTLLSPQYRQKKLLLWAIRTSITVVLYIIFWEYSWVRWTLVVVAPLNIISLVMILGMNYFLQRKIAATRQKMKDIDRLVAEDSAIDRE